MFEANAIFEGLSTYVRLAKENGILSKQPLVIESDSNEVISTLNHELEDQLEISLIVKEISELVSTANVITFSKWSRLENQEAHSLARASVSEWDFF